MTLYQLFRRRAELARVISDRRRPPETRRAAEREFADLGRQVERLRYELGIGGAEAPRAGVGQNGIGYPTKSNFAL